MEQYVKGFQRFHVGEDVRPVTSALASFYPLFQVYYKVRKVLLQSATAFFITKCDGLLLQSATGITKCDDYYKVRQYTPPPQKNPGSAPEFISFLATYVIQNSPFCNH